MPLQQTSGNVTADAYGGGVAAVANYIEDVFSTYLYTQNASNQSINLNTGVGFVSTDAWQSTVLNASSAPQCAFDSSGNYYVGVGDLTNAYVAKFNAAGTKQWLVNLTPSSGGLFVKGIKVADSGAVYVVGYRTSPGLGFVCKLTSSGAVAWAKEYASIYNGEIRLHVDSSENVHVGFTSSTAQGCYIRFDSDGTIDDTTIKTFYTSTQTQVYGITTDSSGNVYIAGMYYNSGASQYYGYVIKFNSSMVVQWSRALYPASAGAYATAYFSSVGVDGSGNVYVAGTMKDVYDVNFLAKYDSAGTLQWKKQLKQTSTSNQSTGLKVNSSGNCFVSGGGNKWVIFAVNSSGTLSWQKSFALTTGINYPLAYGIDADSSGNLLVSGNSNETTSSSTVRSQVLKISQAGLSVGMTAYGTLSDSSYTFSDSATTEDFPSFSTTTGVSFSSVSYSSASNALTNTLISIPKSTSSGGLLWLKSRSVAGSHLLPLSTTSYLNTNGTSAAFAGTYVSALSSNGAVVKPDSTTNTYASWTFRKAPKFFDVVTYTGNGANRTIAHSLGSTPGCIIVKRTDTTGNWQVYHNGLTSAAYSIQLNLTNAQASATTVWNSTAPTSTVFSVGTNATVNANGGTYVACLFAHNAGGFGLTGTDNVISCGSFTTDGSGNATVNLGYEPQWLLFKNTAADYNWFTFDIMRGWNTTTDDKYLLPNSSGAEGSQSTGEPTATGFSFTGNSSSTFIYIAIRRGPMKTPTSGTSVFSPIARAGNSSADYVGSPGFSPDAIITGPRSYITDKPVTDRLRGGSATTAAVLRTNTTGAESSFDFIDYSGASGTYSVQAATFNDSGQTYVDWVFRRAPGFFDVVCYTGDGAVSGSATRSIPHNLASVPELIICKARDQIDGWRIYNQAGGINQILNLNQNSGYQSDTTNWGTPTSTNFLIKYDRNWSGWTFVAYLFATVAGVSKVGSYTGSGTTKQIDCGFTGGARFVLIKRTDSTGDWYVWDTARGMVSGTDPSLLLDSTAAEVNANSVYTTTGGFQIVSTAAGINASGGTYLYLAIA